MRAPQVGLGDLLRCLCDFPQQDPAELCTLLGFALGDVKRTSIPIRETPENNPDLRPKSPGSQSDSTKSLGEDATADEPHVVEDLPKYGSFFSWLGEPNKEVLSELDFGDCSYSSDSPSLAVVCILSLDWLKQKGSDIQLEALEGSLTRAEDDPLLPKHHPLHQVISRIVVVCKQATLESHVRRQLGSKVKIVTCSNQSWKSELRTHVSEIGQLFQGRVPETQEQNCLAAPTSYFGVSTRPLLNLRERRKLWVTRLQSDGGQGKLDLTAALNQISQLKPLLTVPRRPLLGTTLGLDILIDSGSHFEFYLDDAEGLVEYLATVFKNRAFYVWDLQEVAELSSTRARPILVLANARGLRGQSQQLQTLRRRRGCEMVSLIPSTKEIEPVERRKLGVALWGTPAGSAVSRPWFRESDFITRIREIVRSRKGGELSDAALELAALASLAVTIEPGLLRNLRMALAPWFGSEAESEFWNSSLVMVRSRFGCRLRDSCRSLLQEHLFRFGPFEEAWKVIQSSHQKSNPATRLEEELSYCRFVDLDEADRQIATVVNTFSAEPARRGPLTVWSKALLGRLTPDLLDLPSAVRLSRAIERTDSERTSESAETRFLYLSWREDSLRVSPHNDGVGLVYTLELPRSSSRVSVTLIEPSGLQVRELAERPLSFLVVREPLYLVVQNIIYEVPLRHDYETEFPILTKSIPFVDEIIRKAQQLHNVPSATHFLRAWLLVFLVSDPSDEVVQQLFAELARIAPNESSGVRRSSTPVATCTRSFESVLESINKIENLEKMAPVTLAFELLSVALRHCQRALRLLEHQGLSFVEFETLVPYFKCGEQVLNWDTMDDHTKFSLLTSIKHPVACIRDRQTVLAIWRDPTSFFQPPGNTAFYRTLVNERILLARYLARRLGWTLETCQGFVVGGVQVHVKLPTATLPKVMVAPVNSARHWFGRIDKLIQSVSEDFHAALQEENLSDGRVFVVSRQNLPSTQGSPIQTVVFIVDDLQRDIGDLVSLVLDQVERSQLTQVTIPGLRLGTNRNAHETPEEAIAGVGDALLKFARERSFGRSEKSLQVDYVLESEETKTILKALNPDTPLSLCILWALLSDRFKELWEIDFSGGELFQLLQFLEQLGVTTVGRLESEVEMVLKDHRLYRFSSTGKNLNGTNWVQFCKEWLLGCSWFIVLAWRAKEQEIRSGVRAGPLRDCLLEVLTIRGGTRAARIGMSGVLPEVFADLLKEHSYEVLTVTEPEDVDSIQGLLLGNGYSEEIATLARQKGGLVISLGQDASWGFAVREVRRHGKIVEIPPFADFSSIENAGQSLSRFLLRQELAYNFEPYRYEFFSPTVA